MRFGLVSPRGKVLATGEIPDAFAGEPQVLVWRGLTYLREPEYPTVVQEMPLYREVLGQALEYYGAQPVAEAAQLWTTPTAISHRIGVEPRPAGDTWPLPR